MVHSITVPEEDFKELETLQYETPMLMQFQMGTRLYVKAEEVAHRMGVHLRWRHLFVRNVQRGMPPELALKRVYQRQYLDTLCYQGLVGTAAISEAFQVKKDLLDHLLSRGLKLKQALERLNAVYDPVQIERVAAERADEAAEMIDMFQEYMDE